MWLKSAEYAIVYMYHFFNHSYVEDEQWTLRGKEKKGWIEKVASTYTRPRVKQTAGGKPGSSAGELWWPRRVRWEEEGGVRRRGCTYNYDWFALLYSNQQNIVKQLSSNEKMKN